MSDATPAAAPEAAAAAKPEPAGKGPSKKLLIIIAAAVVALAGAGGGAFFFMSKGGTHEASAEGGEAAAGDDAVAEEEEESKSKDKAKGKAKSKSGKAKGKKAKEAPKGPALYVAFEPPFVVNFEARGVMRFLQITAQVMTRDQATADLIKLHDPKLRNDLLMLLGSQSYDTISTLEGKERLRNEALQTIAKVVDEEGGDGKAVEQLYFTSFVMQ